MTPKNSDSKGGKGDTRLEGKRMKKEKWNILNDGGSET